MVAIGNIKSIEVADALRAAGYVAVCYAAYAHGQFERGDVISRHRSLDAAVKAAGPSQYRSWREVPLLGPLD